MTQLPRHSLRVRQQAARRARRWRASRRFFLPRVETLEDRSTPALVAAFGFNEGSGSIATDVSGLSNHGTLSGAAWTSTAKYGSALSFNGSSSLVSVADSLALDLTSGMTLEAWVRPTALSDWQSVVIKEGPNQSNGLSYALYSATGNGAPPAGYVRIGSDISATGDATLALNQWTHLATTFDGSELRLYVNGTLAHTTVLPGS